MMRKMLVLGAVLLMLGVASAQRGGGGSNQDPAMGLPSAQAPAFKSDFTGTLKSFDPATKTLILEREKKGKEETFTGVLVPHVAFNDKSGSPEGKRELILGETLKVYYEIRQERDKQGNKQDHTLISRIDLLKPAPAAPPAGAPK